MSAPETSQNSAVAPPNLFGPDNPPRSPIRADQDARRDATRHDRLRRVLESCKLSLIKFARPSRSIQASSLSLEPGSLVFLCQLIRTRSCTPIECYVQRCCALYPAAVCCTIARKSGAHLHTPCPYGAGPCARKTRRQLGV